MYSCIDLADMSIHHSLSMYHVMLDTIILHTVHIMTQVVVRRRDAMRRPAKTCQHGDITLHGISSYCDMSYNFAQNRKKSILSNNRTTSQRVTSHRGALRRLASYCELGLTHTPCLLYFIQGTEEGGQFVC